MRFTSLAIIFVFFGVTASYAQAPAIDPTKKVENAASFIQDQPVSPGSFVAIFGTNFASQTQIFDSEPLSTSMLGTSVTFNGIPAPIIAVSSAQINAQIPSTVLPAGAQTGTAQVVVTTAAGPSTPVTIPLTSIAPGLFNITTPTDPTGVARPSAYNNSDGSLPLPPAVVLGSYKSRPSKPGEVLIIFATGLGPVNNPPPDGSPGLGRDPFSTTIATPTVMVGGIPAQVIFSGLSPQFASLYQIAITIPASAPAGDAVPLQIQMNGITTTDQLRIAISN